MKLFPALFRTDLGDREACLTCLHLWFEASGTCILFQHCRKVRPDGGIIHGTLFPWIDLGIQTISHEVKFQEHVRVFHAREGEFHSNRLPALSAEMRLGVHVDCLAYEGGPLGQTLPLTTDAVRRLSQIPVTRARRLVVVS